MCNTTEHAVIMTTLHASILRLTPINSEVMGCLALLGFLRNDQVFRFQFVVQLAVKDEFFKSGVLVDPECGGNGSWNIYIDREKGGFVQVEGLFGTTFKGNG